MERRRGFTLIEMLVAVGLVVLMMALFAEVFTIATGTMSRQKGLTENDQRARLLETILRGDLAKRTFRDVRPFAANDIPGSGQGGYFEISENDPDDDTDDVLQFTVRSTEQSQRFGVGEPYYGRSSQLIGNGRNQPEFDDLPVSNHVSLSTAAEVSYFLRGGKLYRRVLLIREPLNDGMQSQPQDSSAAEVFTSPYAVGYTVDGTGEFYQDFDFSAYFDYAGNCARFHGIARSANDYNALSNAKSNTGSLGLPYLRFGHIPGPPNPASNPQGGKPREYIGTAGTPVNWIGRFTQEEASHDDFDYPGVGGAGGDGILGNGDDTNPYTRTDLTLNSERVVDQYAGGSRVAVDLLLANVHAFDIKVWDPKASAGPDGANGRAGFDDDQNGTPDNVEEIGWAGSDDGMWRDLGHSGFGALSAAANRGFGPDGQPGVAGTDDDGANGTDDIGETGWYGSDDYGNRFDTWNPVDPNDPGSPDIGDTPYRIYHYHPASYSDWQPNFVYSLGDVVFEPGDTTRSLAYRCTQAGTSGATQPTWAEGPGDTVDETPSAVQWEAVANVQPLKAIQIRVRFYDVSSGLMRELTIVQALGTVEQ